MLVGTLYTALQKPDDALQQFTNALTVCEPGDGVRRAQILYNQAAAEHARYGVGSAIATLLRALNDAGSHVDLKLPILQSLASYSYEAHEEKGAGEYQRQIAELPRQALTD